LSQVIGGQKLIANFFLKFAPSRYKKSEVILRPDNLNPGVNFVECGHIKVYSITEEGNEKLHIIFKAGAIFPLLWVYKDIMHDTYYEALDAVVLRKATKEEFIGLVGSSAQASAELLSRVLTTLDVYVDRVDELEYIKSYPRVVATLITLAKHFGKKNGKKILIEVPLTQRDIAGSINMTRETASREMEKLIHKRLIAYKNHLIVILDLAKLKKELYAYPGNEEI